MAEIPSAAGATAASKTAASCSSYYYIRADRAQFPLKKFTPGKRLPDTPPATSQVLQQQQQLVPAVPSKQYGHEYGSGLNQPNQLIHNSRPVPPSLEQFAAFAPSTPQPEDRIQQRLYFTEDFLLTQKQFLPEMSFLSPGSMSSYQLPLAAATAVNMLSCSNSHPPAPAGSLGTAAALPQIQYVPCYLYYPVPVPYPATNTTRSGGAIQLTAAGEMPPQLAAATFPLEQKESELSSSSTAVQA